MTLVTFAPGVMPSSDSTTEDVTSDATVVGASHLLNNPASGNLDEFGTKVDSIDGNHEDDLEDNLEDDLDLSSYHSQGEMKDVLQSLVRSHPGLCRLHVVGKSVLGRELLAIQVGHTWGRGGWLFHIQLETAYFTSERTTYEHIVVK